MNKKGEVTDEDFQLLELHGHIGEGRLQVVEGFRSHETDLDQKDRLENEEKLIWKTVQQL